MKLFFLLFFVFSFLSLQVQAQYLISSPTSLYDFNQFDWEAFSDNMNIQEHIKHRDDMFYIRGSSGLYISYINTEKSDLVEIDKQLYKLEREGALSSTVIDSAKGAVKAHHKNLTDIENQIRAYAGLTGGGSSD